MVSLGQLQFLQRRSTRIPFDRIRDAVIEAEPLSAGEAAPPCRLCLLTEDGTLVLTDGYSPNYTDHETLRRIILRTLGCPESDALNETLRGLVRADRSIDAIARLRLQQKMDLTAARVKVAGLVQQLGSGD